MDFHHVTVLLNETVNAVVSNLTGRYVDCTLGGAGHSQRILSKLGASGKLICFDQDRQAIQHAEEILGQDERVTLINRNFEALEVSLQELDLLPVDGIIFDLGVSSPQLDEAERGFSYMQDAPLDMRMDPSGSLNAREIVNTWSEEALAQLIWKYGEEKWSKRIAQFIVQARHERSLETTGDLVQAIKAAVPAAVRRSGPHPAKRTFQAIRIAVNDELGVLDRVLDQAMRCLDHGGRMGVITFHSLEDRIVKERMRSWLGRCTCPPELPICRCEAKAIAKVLTRKPILPSEEEVEQNPRSRSAKLRVAEKI
ncbi:16S rRNA (cytosine(1402)-N(4))-methyltransferase RsmH [Desulfosporosinus sp. BICA1-9]|uniref:16S rRNA (cytosine(1402)-N(4))-methyltransferase RsmH n=1 Tax=Desulfosporosinus sp. BICA1-9 TaxID=1531958 RepID=UPI00054BBC66|nr:16S rRNA (cytosine(1402)-N(4))-methyltransferase RsmH [Desulfosporosinus sp. BICA1-9]KJS50848.1 MAG: 16S rRNA methyltransferase [Peptococcaceae bacterium BRH_c23]KJS79388.1 MAG: 16S rRNA methyltransferase [Desulfosporosinus sp. BICA1-9]HBW36099.1 16S rRNA (cytosine(1402)-N(4))-methyltransferase RsmH [Desulfosporosinus sp.]